MAATTKTNLNDVLKHVHGPRMVKIFNDNNILWDRLQKRRKVKFSGRDFLFPVHTGRNSGVGFYSESSNLPANGNQSVDEASVSISQLAARISLTGLAIESGKSDKDGFARLLTFETKRAAADLADMAARACYGMPRNSTAASSLNGVLCKATSVAGGTTVTAEDPLGYNSGTEVPNIGAARYIRQGMQLSWGLQSQGLADGYGEVTSVNYGAGTFVVSTTGGNAPDANDYFTLGFASTAPNFNSGFEGLGVLVNPGSAGTTFEGISLTTTDPTGWNPYNQAAAGAFDQNELHDMVQNIGVVGGGDVDLMVADPTMSREYIADVAGDVRLQPQKLKGGYTMLEFASGKVIDWVFDKHCPYGVIYFLTSDSLFWLMQRDFGWDSTDGKLLKYIANTDTFDGYFKGYCALGYDSLNSNGALYNISISGNPL
mgnify:CR=1 FL=1